MPDKISYQGINCVIGVLGIFIQILKICHSRYFTHQRVEYEIAVSYLSRGGVFLETIFHESVARVEYGFQKHSSPRKIWNSYLIFHELMCGVSVKHHIY